MSIATTSTSQNEASTSTASSGDLQDGEISQLRESPKTIEDLLQFCNYQVSPTLTPQKLKRFIHAACLCSAIYKQKDPNKETSIGAKEFLNSDAIRNYHSFTAASIHNTNTKYKQRWMVATSSSIPNTTFIAFRGTKALPEDVIADLNAQGEKNSSAGYFHKGFDKRASEFPIQLIKDLFKTDPTHQVIISGHSLGAGIASVLATSLIFNHNLPTSNNEFTTPGISVITFGCPVALDIEFSKVIFHRCPSSFHHIAQINDVITLTVSLWEKHISKKLYQQQGLLSWILSPTGKIPFYAPNGTYYAYLPDRGICPITSINHLEELLNTKETLTESMNTATYQNVISHLMDKYFTGLVTEWNKLVTPAARSSEPISEWCTPKITHAEIHRGIFETHIKISGHHLYTHNILLCRGATTAQNTSFETIPQTYSIKDATKSNWTSNFPTIKVQNTIFGNLRTTLEFKLSPTHVVLSKTMDLPPDKLLHSSFFRAVLLLMLSAKHKANTHPDDDTVNPYLGEYTLLMNYIDEIFRNSDIFSFIATAEHSIKHSYELFHRNETPTNDQIIQLIQKSQIFCPEKYPCAIPKLIPRLQSIWQKNIPGGRYYRQYPRTLPSTIFTQRILPHFTQFYGNPNNSSKYPTTPPESIDYLIILHSIFMSSIFTPLALFRYRVRDWWKKLENKMGNLSFSKVVSVIGLIFAIPYLLPFPFLGALACQIMIPSEAPPAERLLRKTASSIKNRTILSVKDAFFNSTIPPDFQKVLLTERPIKYFIYFPHNATQYSFSPSNQQKVFKSLFQYLSDYFTYSSILTENEKQCHDFLKELNCHPIRSIDTEKALKHKFINTDFDNLTLSERALCKWTQFGSDFSHQFFSMYAHFHQLRLFTTKTFYIIVLGPKAIGKSTLISTIFDNTHASGGSQDEQSTTTIIPVDIPNIPNIKILDTPGLNDNANTVKSIISNYKYLANMAIITLDCSTLRGKDITSAEYQTLNSFAIPLLESKLPILICLTKVDVYYDTIIVPSQKAKKNKKRRKKFKKQILELRSKIAKSLKNLFDDNNISYTSSNGDDPLTTSIELRVQEESGFHLVSVPLDKLILPVCTNVYDYFKATEEETSDDDDDTSDDDDDDSHPEASSSANTAQKEQDRDSINANFKLELSTPGKYKLFYTPLDVGNWTLDYLPPSVQEPLKKHMKNSLPSNIPEYHLNAYNPEPVDETHDESQDRTSSTSSTS